MKDRLCGRIQQRKNGKVYLILMMALLTCFLFTLNSYAAGYKDQWVKSKNKYYYYNTDGQRLKGLKKIGTHTYYMDSKGVQRTGWRKIGKKYYFFRIENGKGGYMVVNKKVNGVKLKKDGSAKLTSRSKKKLNVMIRCQKIIDSITSPGVRRGKKLRIAFEYAKNHFSRRNMGGFSAAGDWDIRYAQIMLSAGSGDCYCYGAIFAYLANALGYTNVYACSSGGHGWCRINGKYYDPNWALVIGTGNCFGVPRSLSGAGKRPAWAANEIYTKNLSK